MSFAQSPNLVPNGSFETRIECIYNDGHIADAPPWFSPTRATPDVFHQCAVVNTDPCPYPEQASLDTWLFGVPTNTIGCENPYEGDGYAGFFVFGPNIYGHDGYKEYIGVRLTNPLVAGNQYTVKFYLSLAERVGNAIWNIQVYFGSDSIFQPDSIIVPYDSYLDVSPQLSGTTGEYITNYDGWHEMAWDYTASGDETFMYIGNFQPDSETDTMYVLQEDPGPNYSLFSYYYIDKVELREGTLSTIDNPIKQLIQIYPNPATSWLKIQSHSQIADIQIFDLEGRKIKSFHVVSNEKYEIDISLLSAGMYIVKILFENGGVENSKFIKR